ncbi:tRNA (adenosine(37)-N6)-dimethylallyltransferase MiaA [Kordiimonas laminariae]|uniref:tRNA (adenosine(37)-N6)-dimethylallyltransferase MiaA n=1 Tax=Kordiimonas laminariae TaxID=2917717 RepID=UPI001FF1486B|nr:tRNA (adenosine(37)-N6)-dimethylallyltransferase MiaA [Kordiimonas laminariae]MCK0068516.1 tRNA (adenosine(37)-N6)-dimethylallyltransferase MiaA [Kordiimonas laminariae]
MKQALFIAGPTASGKSALSLKFAKDLNGVIINADSMQVYKDLRVITACPSEEDELQASHRLYRFMDGSEVCSAAYWSELAMTEIEKAWDEGKYPIVIGGTGMYFKFLLEGVAKIPDIPDDIRNAVREEAGEHGSEKLHDELKGYDPVIAERLFPGDRQRVCRAVEVYRATGKPLSEWQKNNEPGPMTAHDKAGCAHKFILKPPRDVLYDRCNRRFDMMLGEGALEEVEALMERNLDTSLPIMRALGVPSLIKLIRGEVSEEEAIEDAKMQTRRFAKRQLTWFRNQFSHWNCLNAQYLESEYDILMNKISKKPID